MEDARNTTSAHTTPASKATPGAVLRWRCEFLLPNRCTQEKLPQKEIQLVNMKIIKVFPHHSVGVWCMHTYLPHFSHSSTNMFPWSSDSMSLIEQEWEKSTKTRRSQRWYSLRSLSPKLKLMSDLQHSSYPLLFCSLCSDKYSEHLYLLVCFTRHLST